jgi:hypothetical protein
MRDYGLVTPKYWTGPTGRQIRAMGQAAQLVGVYLLTAPGSNMIGLYYLPLVILGHETNCTVEEARQILAALASIDYAHYDEGQELVWVVNMAFYQVGETIETRDKRWAAIAREVLGFSNSPFFARFLEVYGEPFHLKADLEGVLEGLASPLQAPSKGLRRAQRKFIQGPSRPTASPSDASSGDAPAQDEAPPMPGTGTGTESGAGTESGTRAGTGSVGACAAIPAFLEKDLKALGITMPAAQANLFQSLGRNGLRCALVKLKLKNSAKTHGKNLGGLLVTHGAELAEEGFGLLKQSSLAALAAAPKALKDPRWLKLPGELREDLEAQTAWATWHRAETHMRECAGDDDAPKAERTARRPLLDLLAERHPDQPSFRAAYEERIAAVAVGGLNPQAVKLTALSQALGITDQKGVRA